MLGGAIAHCDAAHAVSSIPISGGESSGRLERERKYYNDLAAPVKTSVLTLCHVFGGCETRAWQYGLYDGAIVTHQRERKTECTVSVDGFQ